MTEDQSNIPHWNGKTKFIVITGGVLSGLGKGIVSASIGKLLHPSLKVVPVKCDGYLNVDPGTMNPIEHGEVFVLDDGGEVDMDFGHYERFLNIDCKFEWNLTTGKIFQSLLEKERAGIFLGKTVQMIPHATNEILCRWFSIADKEKADVVLIEIGGTVGDMENMLYLESARQLRGMIGKDNVMTVHLGYVPVLDAVGEQKTKPLQQSLDALRSRGIFPHAIVTRSKELLDQKAKEKISLFSNLPLDAIFDDPDISTVYALPVLFDKEGMSYKICSRLHLPKPNDLSQWNKLVESIQNASEEVTVAICGKYTGLHDSYVSIMESLVHAGAHSNQKVNVRWIESSDLEEKPISEIFNGVQGIIVPGGFGSRGTEGKIKAIQFARENHIPFLGLCFGMQLATVEFARNVCKLNGANSTEIDEKTPHPIIDILPEQKKLLLKGATMRLGSYEAVLLPGSKVGELYGGTKAFERHRHRYEVNPNYHEVLQQHGLVLSGMSPDNQLVEFTELPNHPFFVGTQSHPELKSRLENPAPIFQGFVQACVEQKTKQVAIASQ